MVNLKYHACVFSTMTRIATKPVRITPSMMIWIKAHMNSRDDCAWKVLETAMRKADEYDKEKDDGK